MKANPQFLSKDLSFWADVRYISQVIGYTDKGKKSIKVPSAKEIKEKYEENSLSADHIVTNGTLTTYGESLINYFSYRANTINSHVKDNLMTADEAKAVFESLKGSISNDILEKIPLPLNKQTGDKKNYAFLTCIVNMLIALTLDDKCENCDYDPRQLTLLTENKQPLRTLSRRIDGAYPSSVDPIAIWEIKEYYYTTTFGSRVADGVYETLVDGNELNELLHSKNRKILHFLIIDAYFTWWVKGKAYLCRMIDMLNMGMVDEILFGREVVQRIPAIFKELNQQLVSQK